MILFQGTNLLTMGIGKDSNLYKVTDIKISGLKADKLKLHVDKQLGLNQLIYEIPSKNMN